MLIRLIAGNALRHKLRTVLTVLGLTVAILSFGLLHTVIDAWYAGANAAAPTTLITRNAISLVFPLPLSYEGRIRATPGVTGVGYANWFGGVYRDPKNFFSRSSQSPAAATWTSTRTTWSSSATARHSCTTARARWWAASWPTSSASRSAT